MKRFCNTKITICKLSYGTNDDGHLVRSMEKIRSVWADITQTYISGHRPYFRFFIRGKEVLRMLPQHFIVLVHGSRIKITSPPIYSVDKLGVIFAGVIDECDGVVNEGI